MTGPRGSLPALLTEHIKEIEHIVLKFMTKNPSFFISLPLQSNFHIHELNQTVFSSQDFSKNSITVRENISTVKSA